MFEIWKSVLLHLNGINLAETNFLPFAKTTFWGCVCVGGKHDEKNEERQMQFWEDVEDNLDDIESVYKEKGMDIERLRGFARR